MVSIRVIGDTYGEVGSVKDCPVTAFAFQSPIGA